MRRGVRFLPGRQRRTPRAANEISISWCAALYVPHNGANKILMARDRDGAPEQVSQVLELGPSFIELFAESCQVMVRSNLGHKGRSLGFVVIPVGNFGTCSPASKVLESSIFM